MARPKSTGETKSHQQHLLMTPSEVEAIDTWRFANRIGSRGEAIRRLCQMGMLLEARAASLEDKARHIVIDQYWDAAEILGLDGNTAAEEVGPRTKNHIEATHAALLDMTADASALGAIARGAATPGKIEDAISEALEAFHSEDEVGQELRKGRSLPYFGKYPA